MVYYGPWQEGRLHTEIIYGRTDPDTDDSSSTLLGEAPTLPSGWSMSWAGYGSFATAGDTPAGGLEDPPPPSEAVSQAACEQALTQPVAAGSAIQGTIYTSGNRDPIAPGLWSRSHGWDFDGIQYRMGYQWQQVDREHCLPVGEPEFVIGEYYTEIEPWVTGEDGYASIESAEVLPSAPSAYFALYYKDAGVNGGFLTHGPTSIVDSRLTEAPGPLNGSAMDDLMETIIANGGAMPGYATTDGAPQMPNLGVIYPGAAMGVATFDTTLIASAANMPVAVRIEYRMPRWRKVYEGDPPPEPDLYVPIRQTTHRDDHLAGGAYQTWPAPTSRQQSNTTFGGYL